MEEKQKNEKEERSHKYIIVVAVLCVVAILAAALSILFNKTETKTTIEKDDVAVGALYCTASNPEKPFFAPESATEEKHEIKVTFKGNRADKFAYNYQGVHNSEEEADHTRTTMHADYNTYMGQNGVDQGSLTPVFTYDGSKSIINLFAASGGSLNVVTSKFFFLSDDEYRELNNYSEEDLNKIYTDKGFSCTFSN